MDKETKNVLIEFFTGILIIASGIIALLASILYL
jgi:hypothetical protein